MANGFLKKLGAAVLVVALGLGFAASGAELVLADGGKSDYRVVAPATPSELEKLAVADLKLTLTEITGADFSPAPGKLRAIYVGKVAPGDRAPLGKFERRVTTENGDVYLYGEGERGNVNAVYDFLRDVLGCRWYTPEERKIQAQKHLVIGELKKSVTPSIPGMTVKHIDAGTGPQRWFALRNAIMDVSALDVSDHGAHAGQHIIPTGLVPYAEKLVKGAPVRALKDKAYFATHPEFFSMDEHGKRVSNRHLCYSNKTMRDECARNVELRLKDRGYRGEWRLFGIGQDDRGAKFCCCPGCLALEKKYDHPAGAYYDFLFDICGRFEKKYPQLRFRFLAYRDNQTLSPAKCFKELPPNLLPSYAPLGCDFSKPFTHPANAVTARNFAAWSKLAKQLHWWSYPTHYPRPIVSFPLIANLHRIAENYRVAYRNKVSVAMCEFGYNPYSALSFNDIRLYLLAELCRDITLDEKTLIADFAKCCYGPAAPGMLRYIAELEAAELASTFYLRWNPDIRNCDYATFDNLLRWERGFDEMERLTKDDPRRFRNVRIARYVLDEMLLARWPELTPVERAAFGDLETIIGRADSAIKAECEKLNAPLRKSDPAAFEARGAKRAEWLHSGLDQFVAMARGGKALPASFAKHQKLHRILPNRNKLGLDADPAAPFGLCNQGQYPTRTTIFYRRTYDPPQPRSTPVLPRFDAKRLARVPHDGAYHYVRLGAVTLTRDCQIEFGAISPNSGFPAGFLFDPARPRRLFELYVCMAVDPAKKWVKIGELVVVPLDRDAAEGSTPRGKVQHDEFV